MKKLLALVLVLTMMLSFGVVATAQNANADLHQQGVDLLLDTYEAIRTLNFSATVDVVGLMELIGEDETPGFLNHLGEVSIAISEGNVSLSARYDWRGMMRGVLGDAWWARAISWVFGVFMNSNVRIVLNDGRAYLVGRLISFRVDTALFGLDIPAALDNWTNTLPSFSEILDERLDEALENLAAYLGVDPEDLTAEQIFEEVAFLLGMGVSELAELLGVEPADFDLGELFDAVLDIVIAELFDEIMDVQEVDDAVVISFGDGNMTAQLIFVDGALANVALGDTEIAFGSFAVGVANNAFRVRGIRISVNGLRGLFLD